MAAQHSSIKQTVLVVEDDQGVAMMLRFCFHAAGFEVIEAPANQEAMQALFKKPLAAVVLDLGLPDQLGRNVLEMLRLAEKKDSGSPAWVVISALDPGDVDRQYGAMEGHFLAKPFNPWQLVRTLEGMLSAKRGQISAASREKV